MQWWGGQRFYCSPALRWRIMINCLLLPTSLKYFYICFSSNIFALVKWLGLDECYKESVSIIESDVVVPGERWWCYQLLDSQVTSVTFLQTHFMTVVSSPHHWPDLPAPLLLLVRGNKNTVNWKHWSSDTRHHNIMTNISFYHILVSF